MLTIYVNDLNLANLATLQTLLDDTVTIYPLTDRLIALRCEGANRAYVAKLSASCAEINQTELECLTQKEQAVLEMLTHQLTNRQIGEQFEISEKTVEKHVSNILRKLQLKSRTDIWPAQ